MFATVNYATIHIFRTMHADNRVIFTPQFASIGLVATFRNYLIQICKYKIFDQISAVQRPMFLKGLNLLRVLKVLMHSGSSEYLNNYKDLLWIYYECYTKDSEISLALHNIYNIL